MQRFAALYADLDATTKTNEKVRPLVQYFAIDRYAGVAARGNPMSITDARWQAAFDRLEH